METSHVPWAATAVAEEHVSVGRNELADHTSSIGVARELHHGAFVTNTMPNPNSTTNLLNLAMSV
jgi:hypothetical protein